MHGDNYDTAKMLKRLQRQVSSLRGQESGESAELILQIQDAAVCADAFENIALENSARWAWSESAWSADTW